MLWSCSHVGNLVLPLVLSSILVCSICATKYWNRHNQLSDGYTVNSQVPLKKGFIRYFGTAAYFAGGGKIDVEARRRLIRSCRPEDSHAISPAISEMPVFGFQGVFVDHSWSPISQTSKSDLDVLFSPGDRSNFSSSFWAFRIIFEEPSTSGADYYRVFFVMKTLLLHLPPSMVAYPFNFLLLLLRNFVTLIRLSVPIPLHSKRKASRSVAKHGQLGQ